MNNLKISIMKYNSL